MTGEYISPKQAAEVLGIHKITILRKIKNGEIPHKRLGYKTIRIPKSYINEIHKGD